MFGNFSLLKRLSIQLDNLLSLMEEERYPNQNLKSVDFFSTQATMGAIFYVTPFIVSFFMFLFLHKYER